MVSVPGLDLRFLPSSGTVANVILRRLGVTAPLAKFPVPDDAALDRWTRAHYGGWVTAEFPPVPFAAADLDICSAYLVSAHSLGWWSYETAAEVIEEDVASELVDFASTDDLARRLLDPNMAGRWGCTIVEADCDGEPWPVETDQPGKNPRMEVRPVRERDHPRPYAAFDYFAAALRAGRLPALRSATRLVALGRQEGLRRAFVYDMELGPDEDPALRLILRRQRAKDDGEDRLAAALRVIGNAFYGQTARTDTEWVKVGGQLRKVQVPGPYAWPPIAASIPALVRLWLHVAEYLIEARGGRVAARDTDGMLVPCSLEGGMVRLPDGTQIRSLSFDELDEVLAAFDPLAPHGQPFWKVLR